MKKYGFNNLMWGQGKWGNFPHSAGDWEVVQHFPFNGIGGDASEEDYEEILFSGTREVCERFSRIWWMWEKVSGAPIEVRQKKK